MRCETDRDRCLINETIVTTCNGGGIPLFPREHDSSKTPKKPRRKDIQYKYASTDDNDDANKIGMTQYYNVVQEQDKRQSKKKTDFSIHANQSCMRTDKM